MSVILNFKVKAGIIRCTSNSTIPANSVKHVKAKFIFEEDWSPYSVKIATFTNEKTGFVRRAILDKDNLCLIPWEPLVGGGMLSVDVEGRVSLADGTSAIARASMEYEVRLIGNNVHTDGSEDTIAATPDILTKTLENIELIELYAAASQSAQENAQNAAQSASTALEAENQIIAAAQKVQEDVTYIKSIEKLIEPTVELTWDREAYPDLLSFLRTINNVGRYIFYNDGERLEYSLVKAEHPDSGTEFYGTLKRFFAEEPCVETAIFTGASVDVLQENSAFSPVTQGYFNYRVPNPTGADKGRVLQAIAPGRAAWADNDSYIDVTAAYENWTPESGTIKNVYTYAKTLPDGRYYLTDTGVYYRIDIFTVSDAQWRYIREYTDEFCYISVYVNDMRLMRFSPEETVFSIIDDTITFLTSIHIPPPKPEDAGKILRAYTDNKARWEAEEQTYTTLTRDKRTVTVHCHGLRDDKTYKLCLYTASRHRGNKMGAWYHPDNYNVEPVDGKSDHRMGYGKLAGKTSNKNMGSVFPDVPAWMPNDGFLQTEWSILASSPNVAVHLPAWLLPMVKPVGKTSWTSDYFQDIGEILTGHLIGVSNSHFAGLLFRFCLVDSDGTVYQCMDTLTVGCGKWKGQDDKLVPRVFINNTKNGLVNRCLYTSIR